MKPPEIYTVSTMDLECDFYRPYITSRHDSITYIKCSEKFLEMLKNKTLKIHSISHKKRLYFINKNIDNYFHYKGEVLGITTGSYGVLYIRKLSQNVRLFSPRYDEKIILRNIEFSSENKKLITKIKLAGLENYIKNC